MEQEPLETQRVALLVTCAATLQIAEGFIPQPLPGLKLGLANMVTLIVLINLGFRAAMEIALLRTLLASLVLGTFLSSSFILSFAGAIASTAVMGLLYRPAALGRGWHLGLVGISVAGALTHCLVQLVLVFLLLIRHAGIFVLLPWLMIGAVATGWITGLIAVRVCSKLQTTPTTDPAPTWHMLPPATQASSQALGPRTKIMTMLIFTVATLLAQALWSFAALLGFALLMVTVSKVPSQLLLRNIRRLVPVLCIAIVLPCLFTHTGAPLLEADAVVITRDGCIAGGTFCVRILLLMLGAASLTTTTPAELTTGLIFLLRPLRYGGVNIERHATIMAFALAAMPIAWEQSCLAIKNKNLRGKKLRDFLPALADALTPLCGPAFVQNATEGGPRWR